MPTVLRWRGFRVVLFPPPREHGPPHVHVVNAMGEVIIELSSPFMHHKIRDVTGMRDVDIVAAERLVSDNADYLLRRWRELHG